MRQATGRVWAVRALVLGLAGASVVVGLALAWYGVTGTLSWLHVIGRESTVVVDRCQDLGRNGRSCLGHTTGGASSGRVGGLPYDPASTGSTVRVWTSGGRAVAGTPWGALWFDLLSLALIGAGVVAVARRWTRSGSRPHR